MHHTLSEHAELAFEILFTIHFLNRKAELVIQRSNYKTIKNNDRTNIQLSINKTPQKIKVHSKLNTSQIKLFQILEGKQVY